MTRQHFPVSYPFSPKLNDDQIMMVGMFLHGITMWDKETSLLPGPMNDIYNHSL
uniref:Uncharacterized protein n=1 Tax=Rhizophora mucronata TaxID=61149 RepID=A0A2P2JTI9_RHIMU